MKQYSTFNNAGALSSCLGLCFLPVICWNRALYHFHHSWHVLFSQNTQSYLSLVWKIAIITKEKTLSILQTIKMFIWYHIFMKLIMNLIFSSWPNHFPSVFFFHFLLIFNHYCFLKHFTFLGLLSHHHLLFPCDL